MKKYDRETKKWVDEEEIVKKQGKREKCKGGREHDWMLCLPPYVETIDGNLGLDKVEEYYKIEDERKNADIAFDERLEAIGVKSRVFRASRFICLRRSYVCTVCFKRK